MTDSAENTPTSKSKAYHHGDLRNTLIQASIDILIEDGAAALTLRKAAKQAGVSHTAPYRHFADKSALFAAIAEDGFAKLGTSTNAAIAQFRNQPESLCEEAGWSYVRFAYENPAHLRVMFSDLINDMSEYPDLLNAAMGAIGALVEAVEISQRAGVIGPGDPFKLAIAAWSMVHGIAVLLIDNKFPPPLQCSDLVSAESHTRNMIRVFINGLNNGMKP